MAELVEVAAELYGVPLGEFVAARGARVKELRADGERAVATAVRGLRRPSTAAWAVNQLVRARPDEVEQLLELGAALRDAQASFAGDDLRALGKQQHRVVAALRREAQAVAKQQGQRLSESVAREVEATLKAGMADVDAAAAVRSGLLLRALENTGFTSVDLDDAVALPEAISAHGGRPQLRVVRDETDAGSERDAQAEEGRRRRTSRATQRSPAREVQGGSSPREDEQAAEERRRREKDHAEEERRREEAERQREEEQRRALEEAEAAVADAERRRAQMQEALDEAESTVDELARRRSDVRERLADLRRRLEEAEREDDGVSAQLDDARATREDAAAALRKASRTAEQARDQLEEAGQP